MKIEHDVDHCSTDEAQVKLILSRRAANGWELVSAVLRNQAWVFFYKRLTEDNSNAKRLASQYPEMDR